MESRVNAALAPLVAAALTQASTAVGEVFAKMKETAGGKGEVPPAQIDAARATLDTSKIDALLGRKGKASQGVHKVEIGRTLSLHGVQAGNAGGINTWR